MNKEIEEVKIISPIKVKECPYCGYTWIPRKDNPKSCPRCKRRFDAPWRR